MSERNKLLVIEPNSPVDYVASYAGTPDAVAQRCEGYWELFRQAQLNSLEHLREIRDLLAPYGNFKAWCTGHGLNYRSVADALSRTFGNRSVSSKLTERLMRRGEQSASSGRASDAASLLDQVVDALCTVGDALVENGQGIAVDSLSASIARQMARRYPVEEDRAEVAGHLLDFAEALGQAMQVLRETGG